MKISFIDALKCIFKKKRIRRKIIKVCGKNVREKLENFLEQASSSIIRKEINFVLL
jgi:hypothetical protein